MRVCCSAKFMDKLTGSSNIASTLISSFTSPIAIVAACFGGVKSVYRSGLRGNNQMWLSVRVRLARVTTASAYYFELCRFKPWPYNSGERIASQFGRGRNAEYRPIAHAYKSFKDYQRLVPSIYRTSLHQISSPCECLTLANMSHITTVSKLRAMLQQPDKIVVAPGVFDGLSARIAVSLGFDVLYMVFFHRLA